MEDGGEHYEKHLFSWLPNNSDQESIIILQWVYKIPTYFCRADRMALSPISLCYTKCRLNALVCVTAYLLIEGGWWKNYGSKFSIWNLPDHFNCLYGFCAELYCKNIWNY